MMHVIAGLTLGFLGSLHCIGMCGPLALAIPVALDKGNLRFYAGRLFYNLGRVVTYGLLGVVVGFIGKMFSLSGWQQGLTIAAGTLMALIILLPAFVHKFTARFSPLLRLSDFIQRTMSSLFRQRSLSTLFLVGLVNGLLPCGFVYVGLAGALATGEPELAAVFMIGFGLGTLPAMFGVSIAGQLMTPAVRKRFSAFAPALALVIAGLIIVRGLNLGIPYISPRLSSPAAKQSTEPDCCH